MTNWMLVWRSDCETAFTLILFSASAAVARARTPGNAMLVPMTQTIAEGMAVTTS